MSSGGSDRKTSEHPGRCRGRCLRADAVKMPSGIRSPSRRPRRTARIAVLIPAVQAAARRTVCRGRVAEVETRRSADPRRPLLNRAAIEVEARPGSRDLIGGCERAELRSHVPRREPRQDQRCGRDCHHQQEGVGEATSEEPGHAMRRR